MEYSQTAAKVHYKAYQWNQSKKIERKYLCKHVNMLFQI